MKNQNTTFTAIFSALGCFAFLIPGAFGVVPPPDGGYPGGNTAEGQNALFSLTTGGYNTAVGFFSLRSDISGGFNTAIGAGTLFANTGSTNTAVGAGALLSNTTGEDNNAVGAFALSNNTTAFFNNAHGREALFNNVDGSENNAFGDLALENNTSGSSNTAIGDDALRFNVDGSGNVAVGDEAGTGLGASVSNCIAIGAPGAGPFATFDNTCFIGSIFGESVSDPGTQAAVFVDQFNVVGIFNSSRQYKHDIQPMDKTSETLYRLKPVTFKFNSDWKGTTQYGLIAEEVEEVDPGLVTHGKDGETVSVHYEQINSMLLNEFLKEHRTVQEQKATIARLKSTDAKQEAIITQLKSNDAKQEATIVKQQKQIDSLTANLQRVTAQLQMGKAAPQVVLNNP
jgi:uncharacterized coiled-coil protein SlyX